MPYITQVDREVYEGVLAELERMMVIHARTQPDEDGCLTDGTLNYLITRVAEIYRGCFTDSYSMLSDVHKVLVGAGAEFYRRVLSPYEDAKCLINGDVYAPVSVLVPAHAD